VRLWVVCEGMGTLHIGHECLIARGGALSVKDILSFWNSEWASQGRVYPQKSKNLTTLEMF